MLRGEEWEDRGGQLVGVGRAHARGASLEQHEGLRTPRRDPAHYGLSPCALQRRAWSPRGPRLPGLSDMQEPRLGTRLEAQLRHPPAQCPQACDVALFFSVLTDAAAAATRLPLSVPPHAASAALSCTVATGDYEQK